MKYIIERLTCRQIAQICHSSQGTIHHWLVDFNIPRRARGLTNTHQDIIFKDRDWLYQKYVMEKLTAREIAKLCNSPQGTVSHWLVKLGIPRRQTGIEHLSEEIKGKMSLSKLGNKIWVGRHHSQETKKKMSLASQGSNHWNWKGGLTELTIGIRGSPEYYQWRKAVLERDIHTCQDCGATEQIDTHHIQSVFDYPELIFEITNGLVLCEDCHKRHTSWQWLRRKLKKD